MTVVLPRCKYKHKDCFAFWRVGGVCMLLTDTNFNKGTDCPFFKKYEDAIEARCLLELDLEKIKKEGNRKIRKGEKNGSESNK